jgi:hypothetical protein
MVTHQRTAVADADLDWARAGRSSGARLAAVIAMPISRHRLIRLVRALPDPPSGPVEVPGVDDLAVKCGNRYGTVLIDCMARRVVDVLPGRDVGSSSA